MKEPLSITRPELVSEWHATKNGNRTPENVSAGSHKKVWWRCQIDPSHEWEVSPGSRSHGSGCPFGRRGTPDKSLAFLFSQLAALWHPTKNGNRTPAQFLPQSNVKVWWRCPNGPDHEWLAYIYEMTKSVHAGCPFCAGKRLSVTNTLAALLPTIAVQWHPTKNGQLKPDQLRVRSAKKVWWKCLNGPDHEWQTSVDARRRYGSGCPFCAGQRATSKTSLASMRPDLAAEWHPTKNNLTPSELTQHSGRKVWWRCSRCPDHEWEATPAARTHQTSPNGCPFCSGRKPTTANSFTPFFLNWRHNGIPPKMNLSHRIKSCPVPPLACGGNVQGSGSRVGGEGKRPNSRQHRLPLLRRVNVFPSRTRLPRSIPISQLNGTQQKMVSSHLT